MLGGLLLENTCPTTSQSKPLFYYPNAFGVFETSKEETFRGSAYNFFSISICLIDIAGIDSLWSASCLRGIYEYREPADDFAAD